MVPYPILYGNYWENVAYWWNVEFWNGSVQRAAVYEGHSPERRRRFRRRN